MTIIVTIYDAQSFYLTTKVTNNIRFRYSVGDTIWMVYNKYLARQIELVTLNTIFSGVIIYKSNTQVSFTLIKSQLSFFSQDPYADHLVEEEA